MSAEHRIDEDRKFIDTCVELDLLTATDAKSLQDAVHDKPGYAAQEALQQGLLTASDVDIVHSLRHPLDVVPGYEILELVGRGGMGVVYRAKQLDLERIVALKTVLMSNISTPTTVARFEREAKALARLQHPNIVQALNFGKHQGRYFFAMEFVSGRSCDQALRQEGRLVPQAVWSYVRQVASGLMHALKQNVIHRDIKPANLLLLPAPEGSLQYGGNEVVKITDFGLAMFAESTPDQMKLTTADKIIGSPAFMSPEQFGGDSVDFRADIYSLGATAWNLLFGSPPFPGNNLAALLTQKTQPLNVDRDSLPLPIPDDQWQLLLQMIDPEEDKRPASYQELIARIDRLGIHSVPTGPQTARAEVSSTAEVAVSDQPTMELVAPESTQANAQVSTAVSVGGGGVSATADQMSRTVEAATPSPDTPLRGHPRRRKWYLSAGAVLVAGLALWFVQSQVPGRGPRIYTRVVQSTPLFDGVTLSGWDVGGSMTGAWNTVEAPDASTAIACTSPQGALTRRVPEMTHPRISLFVWPRTGAGPVDIDFSLDPSIESDWRGTLRVSSDGILLGRKQTDFGDLTGAIRSDVPSTLHDRFHVVHIERQPSDWYVFLEQRLVGTIPIEAIGNGNAIRIVVHASPDSSAEAPTVYFADVRLDDLDEERTSE